MLKGVATFGTEEVAVVPVFPEGDDVFSYDGSCAVLTSRSKLLMPVKMAVESKTLVTVFSYGLAGYFIKHLSPSTSPDAIDPLLTHIIRLMTDFHGLKIGTARVTAETVRVEAFLASS